MLLSEFAEINPTITLERGKEYPFVEMADIEPSKRYVYSKKARSNNSGGTKFQDKDTLLARITPCLENGKVAQYKSNKSKLAFGSTEFIVFRGKDGISDNNFIFYLVSSDIVRQPAIKSMTGASGRQRASVETIKNIDVPNISLKTQQKIASILSAYDDLIENNSNRIKILEEMAQSIYKEWFVNFRFPDHENVKMIDSDLGPIPEGWEVKELGELARIGRGSSPRPISNQKYFKDGTIPWIKIADATKSGKYLFETKEYVNDFGASFSRLMPKGSLIMATSGTLGYTQYLGVEGCIHDGWLYIEDFQTINKEYLYYILQNNNKYFVNSAYGAAIQNVNTDILKKLPVLVPSQDILTHFTNLMKKYDELIYNLERKNILLRKTRDLILPRLISGEIDVGELEISPINQELSNV